MEEEYLHLSSFLYFVKALQVLFSFLVLRHDLRQEFADSGQCLVLIELRADLILFVSNVLDFLACCLDFL